MLNASNFALLVHQLICLAIRNATPDQAFYTLSRVSAFRDIDRDEFADMIKHLTAADYLRLVDGPLVFGPAAEKKYGYRSYSELFAVFEGETHLHR